MDLIESDSDSQSLLIVLPLVRYFEADFDYEYSFLGFTYKGHLEIVANRTYAIAELEFSTTSKGHLYPKLKQIYVDYGDSEIYEPNNPFL